MTKSIDFNNLEHITGEDEAYRQELVMLCLDLLKKLSQQYEECLIAKDANRLAAVIHKAKPSLMLLGLADCLSKLKEGQMLISTEHPSNEAIKNSIEHIKTLCQSYTKEFIEYQNRA